MTSEERRAVEAEIGQALDAGDLDAAMTVAVRRFGPEIHGFLTLLTHDRDRANDVFADTCERIWRGLPEFRRECPFRLWAYQIVRREFLRSLRAVKRDRRGVALSELPSIAGEIERVRTQTPAHARSEVREAFARLRESLDPEDHLLLGLRVDRKMRWNDIARVLGTGDAAHLARDAAALRKRYERLKQRLATAVRE